MTVRRPRRRRRQRLRRRPRRLRLRLRRRLRRRRSLLAAALLGRGASPRAGLLLAAALLGRVASPRLVLLRFFRRLFDAVAAARAPARHSRRRRSRPAASPLAGIRRAHSSTVRRGTTSTLQLSTILATAKHGRQPNRRSRAPLTLVLPPWCMRTASASSARGDLALMSVGASLNGDELTEGLLAADGRGPGGPAAPPGRRRSASESFPERLPSRDGSVGTSVGAWAAGFARRGSLDPFAREVVDGEHAAARRAALGGSSQDLAGLGDVEGAAPAAPPGSPAAPPKSRTEVQLLSSFEALDYGPSMSAYHRGRGLPGPGPRARRRPRAAGRLGRLRRRGRARGRPRGNRPPVRDIPTKLCNSRARPHRSPFG